MDILILLLPLALLFFIMSRGRKQQRALADLQGSLAPGQRVVTTAGLHATVVEVSDATVVLEASPGVPTTWARQAVARRLDEQSPADAAPADTSALAEPGAGATAADAAADDSARHQR